MTTLHSTHTGPTPAHPRPDHAPEHPHPTTQLRSAATPSHDGVEGRTSTPAGKRVRMDLELASRLLSSSRWLQ